MTPAEARRRRLLIHVALPAVVIALLITQGSRAVTTTLNLKGSSTVLPAQIRASRVQSVTSEVQATVVSIAISPGDTVAAGQEVALLQSSDLAMAITSAETRLERAKQRLDEITGKDPRARIYSEQLRAAENGLQTACARADGYDVSDLERAHATASSRTKSVERLATEEGATLTEVEQRREEEQNALRSVRAAREHQSRLQQECESARAQVRVAKMQFELQQHGEMESARAEYDSAAAHLSSVTAQQSKLRVVAQRDGSVLAVGVSPGDTVQNGTQIAQIGDASELSVDVAVSAKIAQVIRKGEKVLVRLPTDPPMQMEARVSSIFLKAGDQTHDYVVRVNVPNPDPRIILAGLEAAVVFKHDSGRE